MSPLLVVDELAAEASSASGRDLARSAEAARLAGFRLFFVPLELPAGVSVADALSNLAPVTDRQPALFLGFIPTPERYAELSAAVAAKGYEVVVAPTAHRQMLEVDLSAKALGELTPPLVVIEDAADAVRVAAPLGFPLFLKGVVQSLKQHGLDACVATDAATLEKLARVLLGRQQHTRGKVIARPFLKLRHVRTSGLGFPLGREYRAVAFRGALLDVGAYWEGSDSLTALSTDEARAVKALVEAASARLASPLIGVDVGQAEDGRWWVIETNDPQFMGTSQLNPLVVWHRLFAALTAPSGNG